MSFWILSGRQVAKIRPEVARWLPPGQNSVKESLKTLVKKFVQCFFFNIIASTCLKLYYLFFVWPIFFRKAFFYKIYQSLFERQSLPGRPTTFGLGREGGDKVGQQWHLAQSMCFLSIWTLHSPSQEKPKFTSFYFCFDEKWLFSAWLLVCVLLECCNKVVK